MNYSFINSYKCELYLQTIFQNCIETKKFKHIMFYSIIIKHS